MFSKKKSYYHIDEKPVKKAKNKRKFLVLFIALALIAAGSYLFILVQSPEILTTQPEQVKQEESALVENDENFVKIERINLLVPFHEGSTELTLESGAWHRYPERGDPEKGGNFILSAHRFQLALTPNKTKDRSPFYFIDKLQENDMIDIYFNKNWYKYQIKKSYSVKPDATEIEAPSDDAKLTLYSCSLKGSADGRVVIEATPVSTTTGTTNKEGGGTLLF